MFCVSASLEVATYVGMFILSRNDALSILSRCFFHFTRWLGKRQYSKKWIVIKSGTEQMKLNETKRNRKDRQLETNANGGMLNKLLGKLGNKYPLPGLCKSA